MTKNEVALLAAKSYLQALMDMNKLQNELHEKSISFYNNAIQKIQDEVDNEK